MKESAAVGEFLDETWEILDSLQAACAEGQGPGAFKDHLKTIERNLHTIKGNAAAFGFDELSSAAARTLDWLRAELRVPGKEIVRPEDLPPVLKFTAQLRQYLAILDPEALPPAGFWAESPASTPAPKSGEAPDWEAGVKEILSSAPPVTPQIDTIVWSAIQKLSQKGSQEAVEPAHGECLSAPAAKASAGSLSASAVHAYAFEAAVKASWLRRMGEKCQSNRGLEAAVCELAELLATFGRWSVESRLAPLSSFLASTAAAGEAKPSPAKPRHRVELSGCEIPVLPLAGRLIDSLLDEMLRADSAPAARDSDTPAPVRLAALRDGDSIKVDILGLGGLEWTPAKLHMDLLRQRLERCGVSIHRADEADGKSCISISVPYPFDGMEVLVVQAGSDRIGLPCHRVVAVLDPPDDQQPIRCDGGWLEALGERFQLLDLTASSEPAAQGDAFVLLRTDKVRRALKVDKVLRREVMTVTSPGQDALPGAAFGLCLSIEQLEWLPFLWCTSRLFEQHEGLAARP